MYGCELLFGLERSREIRALVEDATGEPTPCNQGKPCPLLPAQVSIAGANTRPAA
jgi:hypothetical protein